MYVSYADCEYHTYKSAMDFVRFFARHPVFTLAQIEAASGGTRRAVKERLLRATRQGQVVNLRRNLYAAIPPDSDPATFTPDRFLVLQAVRPDAIFCGHSALELLGVAQSQWNACTAYTTLRRDSFTLGSMRFFATSPPSALATSACTLLGVRRFDRAGVSLRGLGPERVLVEGFRSPRLYGGLGELVASASGLTFLEPEQVVGLLGLFRERRLFAAVGWFLEQYRPDVRFPAGAWEAFLNHRPQQPTYLDRTMGPVRTIARWNLLVPERLLHQEEADAAEF